MASLSYTIAAKRIDFNTDQYAPIMERNKINPVDIEAVFDKLDFLKN